MNNFINFNAIVLLLLKLTSRVVLTVIVRPWEDTGCFSSYCCPLRGYRLIYLDYWWWFVQTNYVWYDVVSASLKWTKLNKLPFRSNFQLSEFPASHWWGMKSVITTHYVYIYAKHIYFIYKIIKKIVYRLKWNII